jgi:hypothetical protein
MKTKLNKLQRIQEQVDLWRDGGYTSTLVANIERILNEPEESDE